ncbi:MAG: glycoside hydrolase [candidate division KSB1 bacterium]|nr:glycoside hydrolase [candidate division KSB1 bacterium]
MVTAKTLALLLACLVGVGRAQSEKRIYIANDDHTDYMWRADEETYRQAFLSMLDYYLDLADATAGEPSDFQSRFNCDGSYWVWTYQKHRSAAEFARLVDRMRSGHIGVPLNPLVVCYGGMPMEGVLRSMYYPGSLERRFGLKFPIAISMENQTLPYGLGALWAGAGARYSWKGVCACLTQIEDIYGRPHEAYWWEGPDGSRILMKWYSMVYHGNQGPGGYAEAYDTFGVIDFVDADPYFRSIYPYSVIGLFGKGWDELQVLTDEFVRAAKEKTLPGRRVIVSNELDFFQDFEATYGNNLPTLACSFGNEWDLYCASMAEVSARVKRSIEKLRAAEALAALVCVHESTFMAGREQARERAWMDMGLYFEHAWTADGHITKQARAAWQRRIAEEIEAYVESLYSDASTHLGRLIPAGAFPRFAVFNPLGWERTDYADLPYEGPFPCTVVDVETGEQVPAQRHAVTGHVTLRVLAARVPPTGYRVFEVQPGPGKDFPQWAQTSGPTVETDLYRLTVAGNGAITSLVDKRRGYTELAGQEGGLNCLGPGSGTVVMEEAGPVSVTLTASGASPSSHVTRITLFRDIDRVEIRNEVMQNFSQLYTWDFSHTFPGADVWHEEVGAVILARLTTQGGHYSPRNARYDWLTLNHFADVGAQGAGFVLSNADCYFMRLGDSTPGFLDVSTPRLSVLAGGQVDGRDIGIPDQGGDSYFLQRFALRGRTAFSAAEDMRFALEHQNPLVAIRVEGGTELPADRFSMVSIDNPEVLLWALKPAEDNPNQLVARVWNLGSGPTSFGLIVRGVPLRGAIRLSHIETPAEVLPWEENSVRCSIRQHQIVTIGLHVGSGFSFLPAEDMEAILSSHWVRLHWRARADHQVKGFRVERSLNWGTFEELAFVGQADTAPGMWIDYSWTDWQLPAGTLRYRVATLGADGEASYSSTVAVEHTPPKDFILDACFPNPTSGILYVPFALPAKDSDTLGAQQTLLTVYDIRGRLVRTVLNKVLPPGSYIAPWDGRDEAGSAAPSGVYLVVLRRGEESRSRRLALIR